MPATAQFNMRLDSNLKRKLDEAALRDRRSTSQLITIILDGWLHGEHYRGVDPSTIGDLTTAQRLRPPPGRPRARTHAIIDVARWLPQAQAFLTDRTQVTVDEIIAGAFQSEAKNPTVSHVLPKIVREVLIEFGWLERVDLSGNRVWIKLSA